MLGRVIGWGGENEIELFYLVSDDHPVPDGIDQTLSIVDDGQSVDVRCADALEQMLSACRRSGAEPTLLYSYISRSMQRDLYHDRVEQLIADGYEESAAREAAKLTVSPPGYSEHELGLAVDIVDASNPILDMSQTGTKTYQWLSEHAWEYGFILRYGEGREGVTGHPFAPWHYRYVGVEAAKQIRELDLTFEDYLAIFFA